MKKMVLIASTIAAASMIASCGANEGSGEDNKPIKTDSNVVEGKKLKTKKPSKNLSTDYDSKCGECREEIEDEFNYCIYCGTKVGEGSFEPYENYEPCVYGSPTDYTIDCDECGEEYFKPNSMDGAPDYCPNCGSKADVTEEESDW